MTALAVEVKNLRKIFQLNHNASRSLKHQFLGMLQRNTSRSVEQFVALDGINFSLHRGQAMALVGHNGSGKSTLLRILAGVLKPTSGEVRLHGRVAPIIDLGVDFHPDLTGEENIFLAASLFGLTNKQIRDRFRDIVEFSELGKFIDVPVRNYSSGMCLRLGLSVAVNVEPDILLADEFLTVGDASFVQKSHERIVQMQRAGMTLVLVTHIEGQARQFCQHYIRLEHGQMIEQGSYSDATP